MIHPAYYVPLMQIKEMLRRPMVNFGTIMTTYLDMKDRHPEIIRDATRLKDLPQEIAPILKQTIKARKLTAKKLHHVHSFELPPQSLLMGSLSYDSLKKTVTYFYFTDLHIGLITIASAHTAMVEYARISQHPNIESVAGYQGKN